MTRKNPLTDQEKLSVGHLVSHDIINHNIHLLLEGEEKYAEARNSHQRYVMTALGVLQTGINCDYSQHRISANLDTMQKVFE